MATVGKDLDYAVELLVAGEVIGIPTETVYGLAGDAMRKDAIAKIYAVKNRPATNPLIVHVAGPERLEGIVRTIPENALKLMDLFWPGPLTFLLPKGPAVIHEITAGQPRVAVRVPAHPLTLELLRRLPFPLAAPSANPYGYISPTTAQHVYDQLGSRIDYILDGGPSSKGIESTIIGFEGEMPVIYRKGVITDLDIKKVTGQAQYYVPKKDKPGGAEDNTVSTNATTNGAGAITAVNKQEALTPHITSGMSLSHYAPKTPVFMLPDIRKSLEDAEITTLDALLALTHIREQLAPDIQAKLNTHTAKVGLLSFERRFFPANNNDAQVLCQMLLSPAGHLQEAATHLYDRLHQLDEMNLDVIFAEYMPDTGIGKAINDRLGRAAVK